MSRVAGDVAINLSADVGPLVTNMGKGESSVDRFGKTATRVKGNLERLGGATGRFGAQMARTNRSTGAFGRGVQNAAFQVGDFAVQVGGGVDASRALAQQLPQLLGGFGMLGAVLGAAVAIIVPLRTAMQGLADDGQDMTRVFGTLEPVAKKVSAAMAQISEVALDGAELVVNNIDRILTVGATAAAFFAGKWVAGMVAARVATFSFSASLVALRTALIRTGIGALIVGAGELVYQFTRLVKAAGGFGEAVKLLGDVGGEVFDRIRRLVTLLPEGFDAAGMMMEAAFQNAFAGILDGFSALTQAIANGFNQLFGTELQGIGGGLAADLKASANVLNESGGAIFSSLGESAGLILDEPFKALQRIRDLIAEMKEENITLDSIFGNLGDTEEPGGGSKKPKGVEQIEAYQNALDALRESSRSTFGALGDFMQQFAGKSRAAAIAAIGIQKGLSIAQIIANTAAAQMRALAELGPIAGPPMAAKIGFWGKAQAALVAATGLAQAASGGGGGAGGAIGSGGAGGASTVSQSVAITLNGSENATFTKPQIRELINGINEAVEGGAIVRLA